jgi:acyl-CoA thioester hydrolase
VLGFPSPTIPCNKASNVSATTMSAPLNQLSTVLHVASCEVDSFSHVNNAVYLQYCERARNDYMLQRGLRFDDFKKWGAGPVLFRAALDYRRPAIVDDELRVHGEIVSGGRTRFQIVHRFERGSDQAEICVAHLEFAFVSLDSGRPCRIPRAFLGAFGID